VRARSIGAARSTRIADEAEAEVDGAGADGDEAADDVAEAAGELGGDAGAGPEHAAGEQPDQQGEVDRRAAPS
jgi:hypothetical protein